MASRTICGVLFLFFHFLCYNAAIGETWDLSKDEELEIERQLKTYKKEAIKTVVSRFGVIYDCIDFYKQPAFDHPLLKNSTNHIQIKSSVFNDDTSEQAVFTKADALDCPMGTVPIRRITKEVLIRERRVSKMRSAIRWDPPLDAVVRTKQGSEDFYGAAGKISIHNPRVFRAAFSAARIGIQVGSNWIEAGWRVDPNLFGDTYTHLYVYTIVGGYGLPCLSHIHQCLFVVVSDKVPIDHIFAQISKPGGPIYDMAVTIIKNNSTGNWDLKLGPTQFLLGYWPENIFTQNFANFAEWGGNAFIDGRVHGPEMGFGNFPTGVIGEDAYVCNIAKIDEQGLVYDPKDTEGSDSQYYKIIDEGSTGTANGYLMFYGGPGLH